MPLLPGPIQIISGGTIPTHFHPFHAARPQIPAASSMAQAWGNIMGPEQEFEERRIASHFSKGKEFGFERGEEADPATRYFESAAIVGSVSAVAPKRMS